MKMKFVTFEDYHGKQIIVFPDHIQHAQFAKAVSSASFSKMVPISGGFVVDGKCVGKSISLRLESSEEDTLLLESLQGNRVIDTRFDFELPEKPKRTLLTKNQRKRLNKKR